MLKIIEDPTKFLSTIQIGITLAGFLGSAFAADNFAERLSGFVVKTFDIAPAHVGAINTAAVVIITLILSYFTLVLGELVPKRIAMQHKEKLANAVCGIISGLTTILKPIIWLLTVSTNGVIRLFGINPHAKEESVSEEDIVIMLDAGADEGTLAQDDIEYIKNVFKLERLTAADVMTARSSVIALPVDAKDKEILQQIEAEGYSRIPMYTDSIDKIVGVLHVRNYLLKHSQKDFSIESTLLQPVFVPETVHLDNLFKEMQKNHTHMVIVVNEFGLTSGVVTMEDILEELVGEIWDEQDEAVEDIAQIEENSYRVLSKTSIEDFFTFFDLEARDDIESITVNGWITEHFGNIPQEGDSFDYENLTVTVVKADDLMTHELQVTVRAVEGEQADEASEAQEKEKV